MMTWKKDRRYLVQTLPWVLVTMVLMACSTAPSTKILTDKWDITHSKAAQLFQECRTGLALEEYYKVLYLAELRDDQEGIATALLNLGTIQMVRGDFKEAEQQLDQARKRFGMLGDVVATLQVEISLATLLVRQGRLQPGIEAFQHALRRLALEKRASPILKVIILNGLAMAYKGLDQYPSAYVSLDQAEKLARELDASKDLASTLMNRARVDFQQGKIDIAKKGVLQALDLDRAMENVLGIGADLLLLGMIEEQQGLMDRARNHYRQADSIFDYCGLERSRFFTAEQIRHLDSRKDESMLWKNKELGGR
ncbi:MAG: hypothetical protein H7839_02330 [Magnetococcus sp. YQC-5]